MDEDSFDPFEEDYVTSDAPPRVHKPYVTKTAVTKTKSRSFLSRFTFSGAGLVLFGKALLVFAIILAYPVMTVMSHKVDDSRVRFDDSRFWAVPDLGVSATLIARELDGPGWAADRHPWHPQARLTALPAWQESLLEALADHGRLTISQLGDQRDQDLFAAVRLLEPSGEQNMTERLIAANEALSRYNDRVAGGVTAAPMGPGAMQARLGLAAGWAEQNHDTLVAVASPGDGWIASEEAIRSVYAAKAAAHAAHEILAASAKHEQSLLAKYEAEAAMRDVLNKWRRAASMSPLFVANQSGEALSGLNHPAIMAFRLSEARQATQALQLSLEQLPVNTKPDTEGETDPSTP